uniref:Platelet endothelial aggregation receptor 1 n=1 Tax=Amphiprion percula TaxID=161767 RepID=A0A3P8U7K2_AMPPE
MPTLQSSAVLLLFCFLIGLSCSLNPRDPNVCSLWEFTTSVKESYSHPYDHVTEEPCSDPRTSYRCLRHITYKTAYRQAVKTDYRKRYQCCPGYYESGDKCVRCTKECVHGRCVAPDRCQCEGGWRGDDCSSGAVCTERCPEGRFGPNCAEECVCHNSGKCDPETGQCKCAKGFTGNCNEECAAGTYGQDCKGVCDCANGARCYNIDGGCLCEPGFSGPHCRDRMCSPGKYGMHCERTCLCLDKHTLCHPMKGECTCQPGWAGLYCNETCAHGFYGHGCLEPCLCVNGGVCDSATGRCQCAPGFTGVHCESPCKSGTYGKNCSLECSCKNFVDCSPVDGTCFCKEWRGLDCSTPCSEGTWGPGCNATCHCANGAKCNPADGSCSCTAGWQGAHCDQPCPMGTFGPGCLKRCDCVHADGCQAATGECRCLPGWWPRCSEPCSDGLWGRHCNQTCFKHCPNSDTCLRETGACVCRPGFWGVTCQNCRAGMYGDQCSSSCASCGQSYRCHHVTGECDCLPGYTGPNCDQCPAGYYGKQCSEVCVKCANNSTCNHRDGHCECLPGWTATDCSICSSGRFGPFCAQTCSCPANVLCDRFTGDCLCENGGDDCKQEQAGSVMVPLPPGERESWGAISGIVVLVLLVVLLLALLLLYRRRQKDKQNNTPTVSFSTSRTVNSEYAVPVPHSYHHYYSNPSYHTLSQNRPPLPHLPNNHDRTIKNTNNQLFCSVKNAERERRGLFGVETNATLPADWKHHEPRKDSAFGIDRSYSYSASLGKYYNKLKDSVAVSSSSLNSENPYATIKDLPGLPFCPPESSYMEMKSAVPRERAYTEISAPPPFNAGTLRRSLGHGPHDDPQSHYDLPVNSHIPGHYDLPPVRRP